MHVKCLNEEGELAVASGKSSVESERTLMGTQSRALILPVESQLVPLPRKSLARTL